MQEYWDQDFVEVLYIFTSSFKSLDDLCQGLENILINFMAYHMGGDILLNYQQLNHLLLHQRKLLPLVLLQLLEIRILTPLL